MRSFHWLWKNGTVLGVEILLEYEDEEKIPLYYIGFQVGYLYSELSMFFALKKKLTRAQFVGDEAEGKDIDEELLDCYPKEYREYIYDLLSQNSHMPKKTLAKKIITESEFLPWK